MRSLLRLFLKAALICTTFLIATGAHAASVTAEEWNSYKAAFLDPSGRIVDTGNNNISHSEGQGYGMWLAVLADSMADFELIWSFTKTELLVRDDGLAAWKWDPASNPKVSDINNATDGDILIAYALAQAAQQWGRSDYAVAARSIAKAMLEKTVVERNGKAVLLPAVSGFGETDRADGPVVNPSYYVFEAFPALNQLVPSPRWEALAREGVLALNTYAFGPRKLPSDWVSIKTRPKPADGFPQEFGYNSIRIPLYLARAKAGAPPLYDRLLAGMAIEGGGIATFDLPKGTVKDVLGDAGYRIIPALAACVARGEALPKELIGFSSTLYYPSTLHLLALSSARTNQGCL